VPLRPVAVDGTTLRPPLTPGPTSGSSPSADPRTATKTHFSMATRTANGRVLQRTEPRDLAVRLVQVRVELSAIRLHTCVHRTSLPRAREPPLDDGEGFPAPVSSLISHWRWSMTASIYHGREDLSLICRSSGGCGNSCGARAGGVQSSSRQNPLPASLHGWRGQDGEAIQLWASPLGRPPVMHATSDGRSSWSSSPSITPLPEPGPALQD
jgi:hypothetical protein